MKTKTCVECRYMLHKDTFEVCTYSMSETSMVAVACKHFAPPTNGDKIRQGGNKALLEYRNSACTEICTAYKNYSCSVKNCHEGLKAWLNAPAESEGKDE